jgi:MFS transporter, ACS family, tartrate transporter
MQRETLQADLEKSTVRKVYWRLVPLLFLAMGFDYLDRFNIGFAALRMNHDLGFSHLVFGFGASLFYLGYMLLGIPSNLLNHRIGAQKWLGFIVIAWGLVAVATAFISNAYGFYSVRLLLGIAEAGLQPGIALYVSLWFPAAYRSRAIGSYYVGSQLTSVIGPPISGLIMSSLDHAHGLHGWQWLFIVEGAPAVLLGLAFLMLLTNRPANATWLSAAQRDWLETRLARERAEQEHGRQFRLLDAVLDRRVWTLAAMFACALVGINGVKIWLPQIIRELGHGHLSLIQLGLLSAAPSLIGVIGIIVISYSSDRTGDRKFHLVGVYSLAGLALAASAFAPTPVLSYLLLCVVGFSINAGAALFWSFNSSLMTGVAAAGAIALVNTAAQSGSLISPLMIGFIRANTGNFSLALVAMAGFLILSALIALTLRAKPVARDGRAGMVMGHGAIELGKK